MDFRDFVDLEVLALVSRHVTATLAYIAGTVILGLAASLLFDEVLKPAIHWAETVIGGACVLRGVVIMLWELYIVTRNRIGGSHGSILVA